MKVALRISALIGLFAVLISCGSAVADEAAPGGLECGASDAGLFGKYCYLKPSTQFLGVALGQEPGKAFRGLCVAANAVNAKKWALFTPDNQRHFVSFREIRCSDFEYFQQANMWIIWSFGSPCAAGLKRTMSVTIRGDRIASMRVSCRGRIDDLTDYVLPTKVPD
jgi:hypothetical protein